MQQNRKKEKIGSIRSRCYDQPNQNFIVMNQQPTAIHAYFSLLKHIFQRNKLTMRSIKYSGDKSKKIIFQKPEYAGDRSQDYISASQKNINKINKQESCERCNTFYRSKIKQLKLETRTESDISIQKYYNRYGAQRSRYTEEDNQNTFNPIGKGYKKSSQLISLKSNKSQITEISNSTGFRMDPKKWAQRNQFNETIRAKTAHFKNKKQPIPRKHNIQTRKLLSLQVSLRETAKIMNFNPTPW